MAFSSGLRVPTMSTYYPAGEVDKEGKTEKEMKNKPKLPKLHCHFPLKRWENVVNIEGMESPSLIPQLQVPPVNSSTPHNDAGWEKKTRRVPLKKVIGH